MFGPIIATVTFTTPAPMASAWAAFATVARWPEVLPDLAAARIEPGGALEPGAIIRTIAKPDRNIIDMSYYVIAAEPQRRLVLQSRAQGFRADTTYEFAPADNSDAVHGTRVTVRAAVTPERIRGRIVSVLWRPKFVEQVARSVGRRTAALLQLAEQSETR